MTSALQDVGSVEYGDCCFESRIDGYKKQREKEAVHTVVVVGQKACMRFAEVTVSVWTKYLTYDVSALLPQGEQDQTIDSACFVLVCA